MCGVHEALEERHRRGVELIFFVFFDFNFNFHFIFWLNSPVIDGGFSGGSTRT